MILRSLISITVLLWVMCWCLFKKNRIIILARHGALCWGESVSEAVNAVERLEHTADTLMRAKLLGGLTSLSQHHVDALYKIRASIGDKVI